MYAAMNGIAKSCILMIQAGADLEAVSWPQLHTEDELRTLSSNYRVEYPIPFGTPSIEVSFLVDPLDSLMDRALRRIMRVHCSSSYAANIHKSTVSDSLRCKFVECSRGGRSHQRRRQAGCQGRPAHNEYVR